MAAISHVFTIRRAAQILGRDEDLLWELSDQLEPEDGKLWVYDIDALKPPPSPTMASRRFAKLSRIRSIAPVNLKTSVPRCSAYAYVGSVTMEDTMCWEIDYKFFAEQKKAQQTRIEQERRTGVIHQLLNEANKQGEPSNVEGTPAKETAPAK